MDDQQRQQVSLQRREFEYIRVASISSITGTSSETMRKPSQPAANSEQNAYCLRGLLIDNGVLTKHRIQYYPGGAGTWNMDSVLNVLLLAVLEIGLLLSYSTFLRNKFGFSPLYQLVFLLETEVWIVQTGLFCYFLNVLQYELQHFG
ncbi:unnamed protein product [Phytophthora fragariaefolia]|uniref:Unnamed protein product n=1 Tax=Phytophthora fragariaefolia TaxID=1490495 RepID=A0A9W6U7C5_9STRA|nr:unnamed protein product [Phytophthora fragariaefolia]